MALQSFFWLLVQVEPDQVPASLQLPAFPAASADHHPCARLGMLPAVPTALHFNTQGHIPSLLLPPVPLILQVDPSLSLSALTYFSLS